MKLPWIRPLDLLAEVYAVRGLLLQEQQRWEEAVVDYRMAIELNPGTPKAHQRLGILQLEQGNAEAALASFELAMQLDPLNKILNTNVAEGLTMLGRFPEAIERAQKTLELDADFRVGNWVNASLLSATGKFAANMSRRRGNN